MRNYSRQPRLLGIELLRFVSAVGILVWHYQHFFFTNSYKPEAFARSAQPLYSILFPFYNYGFYAVQVFWLISGFIFFHNYADRITEKRVNAKEFFVLRMSRLYPLHFATLMLVAILQLYYWSWNGYYFVYPSNDFRHFLLNLCFASTWGLQTGDSFNGPVWSVSVEVLIYAAFFYITVLIKPRLSVLICVAALGVLPVIAKVPRHEFALCLFYFYLGGIVWQVLGRIKQHFQKPNALLVLVNAALLATVVSALTGFNLRGKALLIATATPLVIILTQLLEDIPIAGESYRKTITALGNLTYSSYLIHFPIQLLSVAVISRMGISRQIFYDWRIFLSFIFLTLLVARLTYIHFELPAQGRIRKLFFERTRDSHIKATRTLPDHEDYVLHL